MKNAQSQFSFFRPASFRASGVAILLAFLLAIQTFWCGLAGPDCEFDIVPGALRIIAHSSTVTHALRGEDFCACMDQAITRAAQIAGILPAPTWGWVMLIWMATALLPRVLPQRAAVFGRDGPVCVPPLHSRLVRASLPHRAPPVSLT